MLCIVKNKVCRVIIDGGSTENIVSQMAVKKLVLTIGQIWSDIVPMDTCHILLGRQWQLDRKAIYINI